MEALVKTKKIGGSLMVTIPKTITEQEDIRENQLIKIEIKKARTNGFGMLKGKLGKFTKKDKLEWDLE
jgi:hypothetical protein